MKYMKMLGLAAIAAGALMGFAGVGTASATELTSPAGTMVATGATLTAESEGHAVFDSPIGKIECNSSIQAKVANTGGANETIKAEITNLTFTGCTTAVVSVLNNGTLEFHSSGSANGTLTMTSTEVTIETFGAHCVLKANATDIGTLTGGNPATLDISGSLPVEPKKSRSGPFCGSSTPWTGSYKITTPTSLFID